MSPSVVIPYADAPPSRLDTVIEWLMGGLLAFMPLALGAVHAWSEMVVVTVAMLMLACLALKWVLHSDSRPVRTWSYVPVVLLAILASVQLLELPGWLAGALSPNTLGEKTRLLADLPESSHALSRMTLSFYALATVHDLRMLLSVGAVFVVVVNVYRRSEQIQRLLRIIAAIGGALAVLALVQVISGADRIYWTIPTGGDPANSGTFVNHSHWCQFMNLSLGAALGLLVLKVSGSKAAQPTTLARVVEGLSRPDARPIWLLIGMMLMGMASVLLSLSRGGGIALLLAGSFTALLLMRRRAIRGSGWGLPLAALGAFLCVLYLGFDAVYDRLATLSRQNVYSDRWQIIQGIARAWTRFPLFGTGLGTHEYIYPMFDRATVPALADHAENEYAQAAEEMGAIGLVLLLSFGALIGRQYVRCLRRNAPAICSAAYGIGMGLIAVLIHSFSDFGQHLPANAMLSAVMCGLLVVLGQKAQLPQAKTLTAPMKASFAGKPLRIALLLVVAAVSAWAIAGADRARQAEASWDEALRIEKDLRDKNWQAGHDAFIDLISQAAQASDTEPQNAMYRYWLNVYRWRAIGRNRDDQGRLIVSDQTLEWTARVVDELREVNVLCPAFGPAYSVVGQLESEVLGQAAGAGHIRTGYWMSPYDPTVSYVAGMLDFREGHLEDSVGKFSRSLKLGGDYFRSMAEAYVQANRPDLAIELAKDDLWRLVTIAEMLTGNGQDATAFAGMRAQAITRLRELSRNSDTTPEQLAALAGLLQREKDWPAAIELYRRALSLDYGQVNWRLQLAKSLAEAGQADEAMSEAHICLRLRPEMAGAKQLIADVSVPPRPSLPK